MEQLSKLSKKDKIEYLNSLRNEAIKYRYNLNFDRNITFGIEIEYENLLKKFSDILLSNLKQENLFFKDWKSKEEIDIQTYNEYGEEINGEISSSILNDCLDTWKNLEHILIELRNHDGYVTDLSGGHIHIGAQILGENTKYWKNLLILWAIYEEEIIKFSTGEFNTIRSKQSVHAKKLNKLLTNNLDEILDINIKKPLFYLEKIRNIISTRNNKDIFLKKYSMNLGNVEKYNFSYNNTIEFRCPNATLDEIVWQNNINFFVNFLQSCKKEIDIEKLLSNLKNTEDKSFQLVDLVFEKELDKKNFLIQSFNLTDKYNKNILYYKNRY